jgi:hypothetical protein
MAKTEQVRLTPESVDVEYDENGDALYISFGPDTVADESELTANAYSSCFCGIGLSRSWEGRYDLG